MIKCQYRLITSSFLQITIFIVTSLELERRSHEKTIAKLIAAILSVCLLATNITSHTALADEYFSGINNDLSYELKKVKKGAVVKMTNEGKSAIDFLEGTLLFLKDGKLVGSTNTFFTDDYELKPGDTVTKEMTMYSGEFDELKFYYTGRIDKD